jgi:hypothetical protein
MEWKTVSFGIFDGVRGHREHAGISLEGVDLRAARRQERYIEGRVAADSWSAAAGELVEFWVQLAEVFERCLPAEPPLDRLVVEVEPEGGQIKAYFNDTKDRFRQSPLVLNAILPLMDEEYHALPDPGESAEDERAFEEQMLALRERARAALQVSLAEPGACGAMDRLLSIHKLALEIRWESSDPDEDLDIPLA